MLKIGGLKNNIFTHSGEFDWGTGQIRKGMGSIIVAVDGSGDFDDIQDGINALPTSGGSVFIKEGIYYIKKTLEITKNGVHLEGTGYGTQLKLKTPFTPGTAGDVFISISSANYVSIENMRINTNNADYTQLDVDSSDRIMIRGCWFENNEGSASIWLNGVTKSIVTNNIIAQHASGNYAILLDNSCDYNVISNNVCSGGGTIALHICVRNGSDRNILANNVCTGAFIYGIWIDADVAGTPDRNIVIGNILLGNGTNYLNEGTNTSATGNITA